MPPSRRRQTKKQDNLFAQVAKFLEAQGKETPNVDTATDRDYRSADAVVLFVHYPGIFKPGVCKTCGGAYATNRKAVGFCSDPCRREDWQKTTGLPWRAISTHDVWDGDPPVIISPEQFEKLRQLAAWFNTNRTVLDNLVQRESEDVPELEFLEPVDPKDSLDLPDPQILVQAVIEELQGGEEDPVPNPPTNRLYGQDGSTLELTEEEAFLFHF